VFLFCFGKGLRGDGRAGVSRSRSGVCWGLVEVLSPKVRRRDGRKSDRDGGSTMLMGEEGDRKENVGVLACNASSRINSRSK
jgi:hypothetical protein